MWKVLCMTMFSIIQVAVVHNQHLNALFFKTLNNAQVKAIWEHYLQSAIKIPLKDFIRCNLSSRSVQKFFKNPKTLPLFWVNLFKNWFSTFYVRQFQVNGIINEKITARSLFFNSACLRKWDFEAYEWFAQHEVFTFAEMRIIWEFLPQGWQKKVVTLLKKQFRAALIKYFTEEDIVDTDYSIYPIVTKQSTKTKQIYNFIREDSFVLPINVIQNWEKDLNCDIKDNWLLICKRASNMYNTQLKAFQVQFLNRAFQLNVVIAKYREISPNCSFCQSSEETYIHFFWDCEVSSRIWNRVILFCEEFICIAGDVMSKENCLLSNFSSGLLVMVTTMFKRFLFLCKCFSETPLFVNFINYVRKYRDSDFKRCKYAKNLEQYYNFWNDLACDEPFLD